MQFIIANWQTILLILIIVVIVLYLIVNRKWNDLRHLAYRLIKEAEDSIKGSKKGRQRFEEVYDALYSFLIPSWLQIFISEDRLRDKLQNWFDEVKDYLDNGKIDKSITGININKDKPPDDNQEE